MLTATTEIKSSCVECGNPQTAQVNQCDCGCSELAKVGDYISIHSQGELIFGEVIGFAYCEHSSRSMVIIEPDCLAWGSDFYTTEIVEILL